MSRGRARIVAALAVAGCATLVAGCMTGGSEVALADLITETRTVELDGARSVDVELDLGVGKFTVSGGADALMDATFRYNVPEWQPVIDYAVEGDAGRLSVSQPSVRGTPNKARNEWEIALASDVPIALSIDMGVGNASLDLAGMELSRVDIEQGVGNAMIDLSGSWKSDASVTIDGGVGNTELVLPGTVGVRLVCHTGIGRTSVEGLTKKGGEYTNDAYGEADVNLDITINAGVGNVDVSVSGEESSSV